MDQKEFDEMMQKGKNGWLECCYCIHYEDFFAPRENDFDAWCDKRKNKIKNIDYESGCEHFDMGSPEDWD